MKRYVSFVNFQIAKGQRSDLISLTYHMQTNLDNSTPDFIHLVFCGITIV